MISVIVPVLNESETIERVVQFARRGAGVDEVIVVDDGSIDGTSEIAEASGAKVITSTLLGKGASMEDGVWTAKNEVLVFLDGDLTSLREDLIARLSLPICTGQADFVKAKFSRKAGRVTALTARPLLRTFFPELAHFEQPLGGIIAARRSLLRGIRFENDYGVDVGLLLDVAATGAAMAEVDIGHIEHTSRPLEALSDMATQVVRTLLGRAARYGRFKIANVREAEDVELTPQVDFPEDVRRLGTIERVALFDMDGTLVQGRYIMDLAQETNRSVQMAQYLDNFDLNAEERTRRLAGLFAGVPRRVFEETARGVCLTPGAVETVIGLRKAGYRVGIVTDGFHVAADVVRRRVFADFSVGHLLQFWRGRATGEITLSRAMLHPHGCAKHAYCKINVMHQLLDAFALRPQQVLAVGDGENDVCLLRGAGMSFVINPKSAAVRASGDYLLDGSLSRILATLENQRASISA